MVTSTSEAGGDGTAGITAGGDSQEPSLLPSLTARDKAALERHVACRRMQLEEESRAELARRLQDLPQLPVAGSAKEQLTLLVGEVAHSRAQQQAGGGAELALLT